MSYGTPPPTPPPPSQPSSQQPGQPNPYGGSPAYAVPAPQLGFAHWGKRVGAFLLDGLLAIVAAVPLFAGYAILVAGAEPTTLPDGTVSINTDDVSPVSIVLILLGFLTYAGFIIWNLFVKQGRTGYTIGKDVLGIKLVKHDTGQPIGVGLAFVRQLAHILDGFCLLGYLWPLWDTKRQTFADKVMATVVINAPRP